MYVAMAGSIVAVDLACLPEQESSAFVTSHFDKAPNVYRPKQVTTIFLESTAAKGAATLVAYKDRIHAGLPSGDVLVIDSGTQVVQPGYTFNVDAVGTPSFAFLDSIGTGVCAHIDRPVTSIIPLEDPDVNRNATVFPFGIASDDSTVYYGGSVGTGDDAHTFVAWMTLKPDGKYQPDVRRIIANISCGFEGDDPIVLISVLETVRGRPRHGRHSW